jgi:hypothetical protein
MSYIRHYATIITTTRLELAQEIWMEAAKTFKHLSPVYTSLDERHHSIFIPPYNSFDSIRGPIGRTPQGKLIWWLSYERSQGEETGVAWAEVQYGDDGLVTKVVSDSYAAARRNPVPPSRRVPEVNQAASESTGERHRAILVTGRDAALLKQAIGEAQRRSLPVSRLSPSRSSFYRSFCVSPDACPGSESAREAFIAWLQGLQDVDGGTPLAWVAVEYGAGQPSRILHHSDELQAARWAQEEEKREAARPKTFRLTLDFTVTVNPLTDEAARASLKQFNNYADLASNPNTWANINRQRALLKVLVRNSEVFGEYLRDYMLVLLRDCPLSIVADPDSLPDIPPRSVERALLPLLEQLPPAEAQFYREVIEEGVFSDQVTEFHDCLLLHLERADIQKGPDGQTDFE